MKSIFKFLLLSSVVLLSSCSKDEEEEDNSSSNDLASIVVGEWELTQLEQQNGEMKISGVDYGTYSSVAYDFLGSMTFYSDNTSNSTIGYTMDITTLYIGFSDPITTTVTIPQGDMDGTYEVKSNNQITGTSPDGSTTTFLVTNLTPTTMTWSTSVVSTEVTGGVTAESSYDLIMSFAKI